MEIVKGEFSNHKKCSDCEGVFWINEDVYEINVEVAYCEVCYYEYIK